MFLGYHQNEYIKFKILINPADPLYYIWGPYWRNKQLH